MTPELSVIVAATGPIDEVPTSLSAIREQCEGRDVEILLPYADDEPYPLVEGAPGVTALRMARRATLPALLGAAIARARGEVIAITDSTCGIDGGWVASILAAHRGPHPVIGGAVEPGGLRTLVDWAAYFCDYGQFMLPLPGGPAAEMPGSNISMKRSALATGREFVEPEFWKTYWCRELQASGRELLSDPAIVVSYTKRFRLLPYLTHRFHSGRCFAGMRLTQLGAGKRLVYAAGSPLLPLVFCRRILATILPKRRRRWRLLGCAPVILLATMSWALGELTGYLAGPGTSCRHVK